MRLTSLLLTVLLLLFMVVVNGVLLAIIFLMRRKMGQVRTWPATNGVVTASSVETRSGGDDNQSIEYPVIRYSYQVGEQAFVGSRIALGPEVAGSRARRLAERYATGSPVKVFYNPQNPAEAVLENKAPVQALLWIIMLVFDVAICVSIPVAWWAIASQ